MRSRPEALAALMAGAISSGLVVACIDQKLNARAFLADCASVSPVQP